MRTAVAGASLSFLFLLLPLPVFASDVTFFGPIVPAECKCDNQKAPDGSPITTAAGYGCVLQTIQNSVNLVISISIILCVLWLAYAGSLFMVSSASPGLREQGKTRIMNAVIGIVVILAAWLIIDFVMKTLYNESGNFGPWNAILADSNPADRCIVAKNPTALTTGSVGIVHGTPPPGTSATPGTGTGADTGAGTGDRCVGIPDSQLVAIDSSGHKLIAEAAQRFNNMKAAAAKVGVTFNVTSAYRSPDEQTAAWNGNGCQLVNGKAVCQKKTAAIPCSLGGSGSNHSLGTAVDISGAGEEWVRANGAPYGFKNALSNDLIHFSSTGR